MVAWRTLKLPTHRSGKKIDVAGIFFMVLGTSSLVLLTSWDSWTGNRGYDWSDPGPLVLVATTLFSIGAFIFVELLRAQEPLLPLRLFRNPTFTIATAIGLILGMGMFAAIAFLPTFLQMSTGAASPSPVSSCSR